MERNTDWKRTIIRRVFLLLVILAVLIPYFALQTQAADRITITGSNVVAKGKTIQLKADQRVKWKSSKPSVVKVSKNGKVRGIRVGTAVITATSRKNPAIKRRIRIRVMKKAAQRLNVSVKSVELDLTRNAAATVTVAALPLNAAQVFEWSSSDPDTVEVTQDGVLRARKEGDARITCKTVDGSRKSASFPVTVTDKAREEREAAELEASYWNILLVGNSFTQDEFSYVPYLLHEYYPDLRFRIGILHIAGCDLEKQVKMLNEDGEYDLYSEYTSESTGWDNTRRVRLSAVLHKYTWKIVTFQQNSEKQGSIDTIQPYIQTLMGGYSGIIGSRPKYLYVFPHLRRSANLAAPHTGKATFEAYKDYVLVAKEAAGPFDGVIPNATAIENARKTAALGSLGSSGEMVADSSSHLQEGIPCLVANYCSFLSLLPHMGIVPGANLYDSSLFPTSSWVKSQSVPGRNGESAGVTYTPDNKLEPKKKLAADCALAAVKNPYVISEVPES